LKSLGEMVSTQRILHKDSIVKLLT
jgi:hypothetical protein